MNNIKLGDKVRDKITGLEGTVVCVSQWLHGCIRIVMQPHSHKDGKPADTVCFDEPQLEVIVPEPEIKTPPSSGGDRDDRTAMSR